MIAKLSYLHESISYTGKMVSIQFNLFGNLSPSSAKNNKGGIQQKQSMNKYM